MKRNTKWIILIAILIITSCTNSLDQLIKTGIPWRPDVVYFFDDMALENNEVYHSMRDNNIGNQPSISPVWWKP